MKNPLAKMVSRGGFAGDGVPALPADCNAEHAGQPSSGSKAAMQRWLPREERETPQCFVRQIAPGIEERHPTPGSSSSSKVDLKHKVVRPDAMRDKTKECPKKPEPRKERTLKSGAAVGSNVDEDAPPPYTPGNEREMVEKYRAGKQDDFVLKAHQYVTMYEQQANGVMPEDLSSLWVTKQACLASYAELPAGVHKEMDQIRHLVLDYKLEWADVVRAQQDAPRQPERQNAPASRVRQVYHEANADANARRQQERQTAPAVLHVDNADAKADRQSERQIAPTAQEELPKKRTAGCKRRYRREQVALHRGPKP